MLQGSIVKIDPKLAFFDSHFWSKFCLGFVLVLLVVVLSILSLFVTPKILTLNRSTGWMHPHRYNNIQIGN